MSDLFLTLAEVDNINEQWPWNFVCIKSAKIEESKTSYCSLCYYGMPYPFGRLNPCSVWLYTVATLSQFEYEPTSIEH